MLHNIKSLIIKLQAHKEYGGVNFLQGLNLGQCCKSAIYEQNIKISRKGLNYNKKQKNKLRTHRLGVAGYLYIYKYINVIYYEKCRKFFILRLA